MKWFLLSLMLFAAVCAAEPMETDPMEETSTEVDPMEVAMALADLDPVYPMEVLHKSGRFEMDGEQPGGREMQRIEVKWEIECPVAIDGWSVQELKDLWRELDTLAFAEGLEARQEGAPFDLNDTLERLAQKLKDYSPFGFASGNSLDHIVELRVPYANRDWVAIDFIGYDNEGGNGCHSYGVFDVLSRTGLEPMEMSWFAKDIPGLQREVVRQLRETLQKENGRDPFSDAELAKAQKVKPDFLPTPEGIRFRYKAYEILAGCYGLPEVTLTWRSLLPFCDANRLYELRELALSKRRK
ncbi:MAG: RsiV family protein [Candidatus Spyradenecus sp.]